MATPTRELEPGEPDEGPLLAAVRDWDSSSQARRHTRERRLARDLVELSRLDRGSERAECTPLDLARLIAAVRTGYPRLAVDGPAQLSLTTDSRRLARILLVALDNAHRTAPRRSASPTTRARS